MNLDELKERLSAIDAELSDIVDELEAEEPKEEAPTTKICPYCKSEIAIDAVRCPHCTSEIEIEE